LAGKQTPVFFGAAIHNYGVKELLEAFVALAPPPQPRAADTRVVAPGEKPFSGFVFKIQANMDPAHRDRIAFLRVCSGAYVPGMRLYHTRLKREVRVGDAITFMAADRQHVEEAYAGDIIGLHNHGTINIGDSFTQGEALVYTGIPSFAPELFRRAVLRDPLKLKALHKGLAQLCEEGATQLFRPLMGNDLVLGAVGPLQFEVAAFRLRDEYGADCSFEAVNVAAARWVSSDDRAQLDEFSRKLGLNVARDHTGALVYLAPTTVSLTLTQERWPKVRFSATRELSAAA
jgi:peptide chain release factor 3